ncbi:protein maelstrom homolog [Prorops nasuta]|uniref:protein maelstrom homolog n=1 Tax=Prorops nasuta TaxID=863751 RepID=UPI0034CE7B62
MPKPKGRNAFYFFMQEWKEQMCNKGEKFPNGLKDVQQDQRCHRAWLSLSTADKSYYKNLSVEDKEKCQKSSEKKTTLGESISDVEYEEKLKQKYIEEMKYYISSIVNTAAQNNELKKMKFFILHVNWFYERQLENKIDYFPAEFTLAEFSIEEGVLDVYHEICGVKIPLGFRREAKERSQETHKIPPELPGVENDFRKMFEKFSNFMQLRGGEKKVPPIYVPKKITLPAKSLITKLITGTGIDPDLFKIYELEYLFMHLRNAAAQKNGIPAIPYTVADYEFNKEEFAYFAGRECEFHQSVEDSTVYCTKSKVYYSFYTISDHICEHLGITMMSGVHCPIKKESSPPVNFFSSSSSFDSHSGLISSFGKLNLMGRRYVDEDEERKKTSRPLTIIDYSKINKSTSTAIPERPLRLPKTKAISSLLLDNTDESIDFDEDSFPPIGPRRNNNK